MEQEHYIVTLYTFYCYKWEFDTFYFKKRKIFCTLKTDARGHNMLHPENYYRDFYLDDESLYFDVTNDEEYLMIDYFTFDDNAMEDFKRLVIKYLLRKLYEAEKKNG